MTERTPGRGEEPAGARPAPTPSRNRSHYSERAKDACKLLVILVQSLQGLVDGPHDIPETTVRRRLAAVQAALDDISGAITLKE